MGPDLNPSRRRVGILGGSFDPIHFGHLRLAESMREALALDTVLFVPAQVSPFKTGRTTTPAALRAKMVGAAIDDNPLFQIWTGELERPGPSFTVDTLR
ncbi:MAG: nicotinate-nicotinamide nucleotide adenylyltransferase, partial [Armatimonadaceae bacterium]